jgi:hypothetical protein
MTMIYHGTSTSKAISIAMCGKILSPLTQAALYLQEIFSEKPAGYFQEIHPGKTIQDVALGQMYDMYAPREIETRAKCVCLTKDFGIARGFAMSEERRYGGLVLGMSIEDNLLSGMSGNSVNLFMPGSLSIDNLTEVHLSPTAKKNHEERIKDEFGRYHHTYSDMK